MKIRRKPSTYYIYILYRHIIRNITSALHSNNIFVRILFDLIVAALFLLIELFDYLVIRKYMSTTIRINGTVQFTAIMEKHMRQ